MIQLVVARLLFGANTSNILRHCVRARAPFLGVCFGVRSSGPLDSIGLDWFGSGESSEQLLRTTAVTFAVFIFAEAEQYREVCAWGRFVPVRWLRNALIEQKNSSVIAVIWLILVAELLLSLMRD